MEAAGSPAPSTSLISWSERLAATPVAVANTAQGRRLVELGEVVEATRETGSYPIYRRDGRDAEMVMADLAGRYEAPIYGMLAVERHKGPRLGKPAQARHPPERPADAREPPDGAVPMEAPSLWKTQASAA